VFTVVVKSLWGAPNDTVMLWGVYVTVDSLCIVEQDCVGAGNV
jgi:hypothetical protein